MRVVELEIKNWEKFHPRTDVKTARWFKMSNEFFNDPEFYGLSLESRMVWLFLLCSASKKMSGHIKVNTQMIADNLKVRVESIDFSIQELTKSASLAIKPLTLVSNDLEHERKDEVTLNLRALEKRREEERREDKKNTSSELGQADSDKVAKGPVQEFNNSLHEKLLSTVLQDTQRLWLQTYQDLPWIQSEFTKMVNWLKVNPKKAPKSRLDRFISNWLSRGWEDYRKTLPGKSSMQSHRTQSDVTAEDLERAKQLGII